MMREPSGCSHISTVMRRSKSFGWCLALSRKVGPRTTSWSIVTPAGACASYPAGDQDPAVWESIPPDSDLLFYEGLHGGVVAGGINMAEQVDLLKRILDLMTREGHLEDDER